MADLFLSAPLKKTVEVDLTKPLRNLIASLYSNSDSPSDYTSSITELNKLRAQACSKTVDKSAAALEVMCRYHDQLISLHSKIPPHEVQIAFKWRDAFDKGSLFAGRASATATSLSFEKTCLLFNIASLQSQIASSARLEESDEELRSAARMFQLSSGIYATLRSTAAATFAGQEPTPDLQQDTLQALSTLMLAQAQELFLLKAINDKMKEGVVAKIAAQGEDLYTEALKHMQKDTVKGLWEREWAGVVSGKAAALSALSNYYQSQVNASKKQVGEQISRLTLTLELLSKAQSRAGQPLYQDYLARATRSLAEARKDNDFIYHERVPETSTLSPVERSAGARLAKPIQQDMMASNFKDLFDSLTPLPVHQAVAACELRKNELVNLQLGRLAEATQTLNGVLASLNLPAAIEDDGQLPVSLKEKASRVKESGGVGVLEFAIKEMPELVQRNKEILDEADRLLHEEEDSDTQLRSQLKEKWTRTPSDKLNATFKTNSSRYREIINNALAADEVVRQKFSTHRPAMELLSGGPESLASSIPQIEGGSGGGGETREATGAKKELRKLMGEVTALTTQRDSLTAQLKSHTFDMRAPFLAALAADGALDEQLISIELLGREYGKLQQVVQESLSKQESLLSKIREESSAMTTTGGRREQVTRQLAEGYDAFIELEGNIREGTKFYNDLTQLLLAFQNKLNDFCFARRTEKEELLKDVTREASQPSAAPPARPAAPPQQYAPPPQQPGPAPLPYPLPGGYNTMPMPAYFTPAPMPTGYNPYATYAPGYQQQNYGTAPPYPQQVYNPYYPQQGPPPPQ